MAFGDSCYKLVNISATFSEAQSYCEDVENNAELLSIHSHEENNFIGELIKDNGIYYVYLGGSVTPHGDICHEDEVKWSWTDGSPWNFTRWYPDYPTCSSYYYCTELRNSDFGVRWYNTHCTSSNPFVCKM